MPTKIILASLLALVGYAYTDSKAELASLESLAEFQIQTNATASAALIEETEQQIRLYEYHMEDDSKLEYRSLTPVIDQLLANAHQVGELKEHFTKKILTQVLDPEQQNALILSFMDSTRTMMNESRAIMDHYLTTHAGIFGLRSKDVENYCEHAFSKLRFSRWSELSSKLAGSKAPNSGLLSSLYLDLNSNVNGVVSTLTSMVTGRQFSCGFGSPLSYYPIKTGNVQGDLVTIIIQCSGYVYKPDQPNVKLKVNGKPFQFDYNGIVTYQGRRQVNGQLKIEYWVRNPITGKEYEGKFDYRLDEEYAKSIL